MKKITTIMFASIFFLVSACKNETETKSGVDNATITKEVTESESKLFSLLKDGKVNEAFGMHSNTNTYRNILDGFSRTHSQMDSVLKNNASNNVKAYNYVVSSRDFLIVDNDNVLETIQANRKLINSSDSTIENKPITLSILWTKDNEKWNVSYLHSSYKINK